MLFLLMLLPYVVSACTGSTCLYMPFLQGLSFANCKEAISRSTSHECKQILLASVEWWHFGKKTKKAWASTIMSNVTRRQGHRTLVSKKKKTNYISETTRLEFSKFQAVIPPIDSTARTWRPEIYIRKWWPCVFLCWCNCFEITFRCHIDRMPNIWTILYWTYIHVMIMILLVIMTHASWHRHVICI